MFLSDSHSDGTHSHPLLRHISTNLMKKQSLISAEGELIFPANVHFFDSLLR